MRQWARGAGGVVVALGAWLAACGGDGASDGAGGGGSSGGGSSGGASPWGGGGSSSGAGGGGSSGGGTSGAAEGWRTEWVDGIVTYYDATGEGSCSYDAGGSPLLVTAVSAQIFGDSQHCGGCVEIEGEAGSVVVQVVDQCPECAAEHLDLSPEAFLRVVPRLEIGRAPVRHRFVQCAQKPALSYRYKDGSSRWWTAIQVLGHDVPLNKLEYQRDGAWVAIPRGTYGYFVAKDGVGVQPAGLRLRVTGVDGRTREDLLPAIGDEPLDTVVRDGGGPLE